MPKLTDKQLLSKEPYNSILELLKKDIEEKGLKANHFMETLKIKDSDYLNKCLRVLIRKGWVEKKGIPRYYRYFLSPSYFSDKSFNSIHDEMKLWHKLNIINDYNFDRLMKVSGFPNEPRQAFKTHCWTLCGIPKEIFFNQLSLKEKTKLNKIINNIISGFEELLLFKLSLDDEINTPEKVDKAIQKYGLDNNDLMQLQDIGFYYRGTPIFDENKFFKEAKK